MNCSQKLISLIFGTTHIVMFIICVWLWIALKSWYLWYSEQRQWSYKVGRQCCELLSKVDIFDIRNNSTGKGTKQQEVVNCSQKLISLIFGTTGSLIGRCVVGLWIALKSWYLWYSEQHTVLQAMLDAGCELLSKVDIFDIRNNSVKMLPVRKQVVNCSQKLISLIFGTTIVHKSREKILLWIALKSWYLWYSEQLLPGGMGAKPRCELLSKVDIFDIRNNI